MSIRRVALIYDDKVRPDTTGTHCRSALEEIVEVVHFHPSELDHVPRDEFDLYLNIDDGLRYNLPDDLCPSAWWAIDTHMDLDWYKHRAPSFDFVFTAQRNGAQQLRENGITNVHWLPLACNPAIHRKHEVSKELDICFVGNIAPGPRTELLRLIQKQFHNTFVGQRHLDEMARTFSASCIVFNRSIKDDLNMRVFEALACGSLLLTNDLAKNGQDELFLDGVHLVTYKDSEELLEKADYYLRHEDERERIAAAGREVVLQAHTYRHRMEEILCTIEDSQTIENQTDQGSTGWGYFDFTRPELLALIPTSVKRVLDIGCGSGRLGGALKARQPAKVIGVELNAEAGEAARTRLDDVIVGDVETLEMPFTEASFDCIVCGDVLEHLCDPKRFLQRARRWLSADGRLIASIPNVRHHSVVQSLLEGNWSYESAGLLDETHLRFFARRDIAEMFRSAGYEIDNWQLVPAPGEEHLLNQVHGGQIRMGKLDIEGISSKDIEEYFAYQYLLVARLRRASLVKPSNNTSETKKVKELGCVIGIRNRPPKFLERTFQTYTYQNIQPGDKVLVDYGSFPELNQEYSLLSKQYGWRLICIEPEHSCWSSAIAYNRAVWALDPAVRIVFKNDVDILLGENVLEYAVRYGTKKLCIFSCFAAQETTKYPERFSSPGDITRLLSSRPEPQNMDGEGICAFPRKWFEKIGGYDMNFQHWGFEDSDLRFRAERSISTRNIENLLLIHQWHPRSRKHAEVMQNRDYYEWAKRHVGEVRNNGHLVVRSDTPSVIYPSIKTHITPKNDI